MVKWEDCYMCGGSGELTSGKRDKDGNPIMKQCAACHGTGRVVKPG